LKNLLFFLHPIKLFHTTLIKAVESIKSSRISKVLQNDLENLEK